MSTILQFLLGAFALLDFGIFGLSNFDNNKFLEFFPQYASTDPKFPRLIGSFFLMAGIARLHGASNIKEKGAYRIALWSWLIEMLFHGIEIYHGQYELQDPKIKPVFVLCGAMFIYSTLMYKNILYPKVGNKSM